MVTIEQLNDEIPSKHHYRCTRRFGLKKYFFFYPAVKKFNSKHQLKSDGDLADISIAPLWFEINYIKVEQNRK